MLKRGMRLENRRAVFLCPVLVSFVATGTAWAEPRGGSDVAARETDAALEVAAREAAREAIGRPARVELRDRQGNVVGQAMLLPVPVGVAVRFEGMNLPPGPRAFHVHEHGACDPEEEFQSAGGHWAPGDREHGYGNPDGPHLGDMPNLQVAEDGTTSFHYVIPGATLQDEGDHSLVAGDGTTLVIHAGPDDYKTDPDGAAGARIACGVIETADRS